MEVLKVVAEGVTTSFRYPHFMQGVQPTFEMPPPATLYGHICSALGTWFDPTGVQFAVHFAYRAQFDDLEQTYIFTPAAGNLPDSGEPQVLSGAGNPFVRGILFLPRLVLYVNRPEWLEAFRSPCYAVALGRSQDLFTYTSVETVRLERSTHAYLEHTLAPYSLARQTGQGVVVLMPRFLDYKRNRHPTFGRYVVLHRRVHSKDLLRFGSEPEASFWVDPTSPVIEGDHLGLLFHTWVGEDESVLQLA